MMLYSTVTCCIVLDGIAWYGICYVVSCSFTLYYQRDAGDGKREGVREREEDAGTESCPFFHPFL